MLVAPNLAPFFASIQAWVISERAVATQVAKGLSAAAFNELPTVSAQYSGDFAANWRYDVGKVDTSFTPNALPKSQRRQKYTYKDEGGRHAAHYADRKMGDIEAVSYAYSHNAGKEDKFVTLGPTIYISNSAEHTEFYAWKIENDQIKFREGNEGHPVAKTTGLISAMYGGVLTPIKIAALLATKIGRGA